MLIAVLAVLTTTGWAANHFAAVLPVLRESEGLSDALVDGVFGIYAVGLLPGLFFGGALSDRVGRAKVALPGAAIALAGSILLASWHDGTGLTVGRLVVGLGAGLTIGAGTAWAADLRGPAGTALAGVFLTSGFAFGPVVSGVLAQFGPDPTVVPFVVSAAASLVAIGAALVMVRGSRSAATRSEQSAPAAPPEGGGVGVAFGWSLPLALWVFSSVTVMLVTVPARLPADLEGPLLSGIAAGLALGSGIVVQTIARRRTWGPRAGTVGAALSAFGFVGVSIGGSEPSLPLFVGCCLVLGSAYGLCLRSGLLDLERYAPPAKRGLMTGVFYVATYLGFGLPVLLVVIEPSVGIVAPTLVLAAAAAITSGARAIRLRRSADRLGLPIRN